MDEIKILDVGTVRRKSTTQYHAKNKIKKKHMKAVVTAKTE